ncbi:MAG: type II secretion system protein [Alphaproteobacteria bacterium]|nr:type II secretion system protein [Alphaproteobacteria bacterium]
MPMSGFRPSRRPIVKPRRRRIDLCCRSSNHDSAGFTLLEILVTLTLIGLVSVAVLPRMSAMADSVVFALNRETFEQNLGALTYQAHKRGEDLLLVSIEDTGVIARGKAISPLVRQYRSVDLPLPAGWSLDVPTPIIYRASGYCAGGAVTVAFESIKETYILRPPLCEADNKM